MKLALDVYYLDDFAVASGISFKEWDDAKEENTYVKKVTGVGDYVSGEFYKRELPCLLRVVEELDFTPSVIVIDGYVTLDAEGKPGLGMHLWNHLGHAIPIIGAAKTRFAGIPKESELLRGKSTKPLYITAIGLSLDEAKKHIGEMHGTFRIPTLLKKVDQLSRQFNFDH
jgi:deoxyribonuclease V